MDEMSGMAKEPDIVDGEIRHSIQRLSKSLSILQEVSEDLIQRTSYVARMDEPESGESSVDAHPIQKRPGSELGRSLNDLVNHTDRITESLREHTYRLEC